MHDTFWSCLIRCANIKLIRIILWKLQSGHDFVHRQTDRRTDGQTDGRTDRWTDNVKPVYPLSTSLKGGMISNCTCMWMISMPRKYLELKSGWNDTFLIFGSAHYRCWCFSTRWPAGVLPPCCHSSHFKVGKVCKYRTAQWPHAGDQVTNSSIWMVWKVTPDALKNFWWGCAAPVFDRIPLAKKKLMGNIPLAKDHFLILSPFLHDFM